MQVNSNSLQSNNIYNPAKKEENQNKSFSASMFMQQVDPEIAQLFEEFSANLDPDTKLKRAMSMSLHLSSGPMFLHFKDGNYPDGMPDELKTSMEVQNKEWNALESDKEKNIYTLDWMIDHIGHEISSDPEFEQFLKDIRASYAGEVKSDFKTRDEINDEDPALQQFKKDLTTKGAVKFLYDFNMEKIEKMVEEYRDKLIKELGENPSAQDLKTIDEKVNSFRKDLLERLMEANDKDKNSPLNINRIEFEIMNNMNSKLQEALRTIS